MNEKTGPIKTGVPAVLLANMAIARMTFRDIVRDKILYNVLVSSLLLLGAGMLASRFTFVQPERVVIDFGLAVMLVSGLLLSTLVGGGMTAREFERRTAFVTLSKPISRPTFLVGKYLGLLSVLSINWLLQVLSLYFIYNLSGGEMHPVILWAFLLNLLQCWVVGALVVMFSCFTTASLSVVFTLGVCAIGMNVSQIRYMATKSASAPVKAFLNFISALLPNLEFFNLGTKVTYGLPVTASYLCTTAGYAFLLICVYQLVGSYLIRNKEL